MQVFFILFAKHIWAAEYAKPLDFTTSDDQKNFTTENTEFLPVIEIAQFNSQLLGKLNNNNYICSALGRFKLVMGIQRKLLPKINLFEFMRIYNCDTEKTLQNVELYLTSEELEDLEGLLYNSIELNKEEFFDSGNLFGEKDGFNVIPPYAEFVIYSNDYIENMDSTSKRIIFTDK